MTWESQPTYKQGAGFIVLLGHGRADLVQSYQRLARSNDAQRLCAHRKPMERSCQAVANGALFLLQATFQSLGYVTYVHSKKRWWFSKNDLNIFRGQTGLKTLFFFCF